MRKKECHGISVANNSDSFANRSLPRLALQPTLGILAQWWDRNDPLNCPNSLVAWVRVTHLPSVIIYLTTPSGSLSNHSRSKSEKRPLSWINLKDRAAVERG